LDVFLDGIIIGFVAPHLLQPLVDKLRYLKVKKMEQVKTSEKVFERKKVWAKMNLFYLGTTDFGNSFHSAWIRQTVSRSFLVFESRAYDATRQISGDRRYGICWQF